MSPILGMYIITLFNYYWNTTPSWFIFKIGVSFIPQCQNDTHAMISLSKWHACIICVSFISWPLTQVHQPHYLYDSIMCICHHLPSLGTHVFQLEQILILLLFIYKIYWLQDHSLQAIKMQSATVDNQRTYVIILPISVVVTNRKA